MNLISILYHVLQTEIQILGGAESDESAVDGDHKSNEEYSSHGWKAALGVDKFHESGDYKVGNGHEPGCSHDNTGHLVALKNKRKTKADDAAAEDSDHLQKPLNHRRHGA